MLQVSLDVRGKRTLEESLDFYVQGELMEGDNQYLCEELGKKVGTLFAPSDFQDSRAVQRATCPSAFPFCTTCNEVVCPKVTAP